MDRRLPRYQDSKSKHNLISTVLRQYAINQKLTKKRMQASRRQGMESLTSLTIRLSAFVMGIRIVWTVLSRQTRQL